MKISMIFIIFMIIVYSICMSDATPKKTKKVGKSAQKNNSSGKAELEKPLISLKSNDGKVFTVKRSAILRHSGMLSRMYDDIGEEMFAKPIFIEKANSETMRKVIEWCEHDKDDAPAPIHDVAESSNSQTDKTDVAESSKRPTTELSSWDAEFLNVDLVTLVHLMLAANYLEMSDFISTLCKAMYDTIKGKTPDEIRKIFNIKNKHTDEELAYVERENSWTYDDPVTPEEMEEYRARKAAEENEANMPGLSIN